MYGVGSVFRWDIKEEESGFSAYQVVVDGAMTKSAVTEAVMNGFYGNGYEQKLINDYYAAIEGILPIEYKQPYLDFLNERKALKAMIHEEIQ